MRTSTLLLALLTLMLILLGVMHLSTTGFFILQGDFVCENCNLLIFTVDTLRADHSSSYGYFQKTTPIIDSLSSEGVMFMNAFSQIPHTPPSHWSIFTGLYPYKHGKFFPHDNGSRVTTLSDILRKNGYLTAAFVSSKMLEGFAEEFDYFNGRRMRKIYRGPVMKQANETTSSVLSWLENHSSEKFFLWVHYFDPHSPYKPPKAFDAYNYSDDPHYSDPRYDQKGLSGDRIRNDIAKYDGEIRFADENIGLVLNKLKELGIEDTTLVILLSDHGECFGEHNFSDFGYEENRPCIFHGKTLYDEEIHVPLIIKNPKSRIRGVRIGGIVETVDLFPTILEILNVSYDLEVDGESLLRLIRGGGRAKDYTISQTRPRKGGFAIGIRTDEWKFVMMKPAGVNLEKDIAEQEGKDLNFTENGSEGRGVKKLLFKVSEKEGRNLFEKESEIAEELEKRLRNVISEIRGPLEIDRDTESLLKSLGYM